VPCYMMGSILIRIKRSGLGHKDLPGECYFICTKMAVRSQHYRNYGLSFSESNHPLLVLSAFCPICLKMILRSQIERWSPGKISISIFSQTLKGKKKKKKKASVERPRRPPRSVFNQSLNFHCNIPNTQRLAVRYL
jgi:hypothetical protein